MTGKFQNRYRISSTRLAGWNYGWSAAYFVTICTKDRECFFGEIVGEQMQLSGIGKIANDYWMEIPNHFPFVKLDEHVMMPNHVHGIIMIDQPGDGGGSNVETQNFASLPQPLKYQNVFGPQSKNLASVIRGYKSAVKKYATLNNINFAWQPRFHDHIIRDQQSFQKISNYIINNPMNWSADQFYR